MTDWADEKALELAGCAACYCQDIADSETPPPTCTPCQIAAALREARERGAREERRGCHAIAYANGRPWGEQLLTARCSCAEEIAARGPMSEPKEEK